MSFIGRNIHVLVISRLSWATRETKAGGRQGGHVDNARGRRGDREHDEAEAVFGVMLRPIASSLPPGFFAFMAGTVLLTVLELQWVPEAEGGRLMLLVLALIVPLEATSGLFAFPGRRGRARSSLEGTFGHQAHPAEQEAGVRRQP
jgi:hypothetical protein